MDRKRWFAIWALLLALAGGMGIITPSSVTIPSDFLVRGLHFEKRGTSEAQAAPPSNAFGTEEKGSRKTPRRASVEMEQ